MNAPYIAIIDGETKRFETAEEKFTALVESYEWHNAGLSIRKFNDFSYWQIIGMGPEAVPLLMKQLEDGGGDWYFALKCITGQEAETPDMHGDAEAVRKAWVRWGRSNGYLPEPQTA